MNLQLTTAASRRAAWVAQETARIMKQWDKSQKPIEGKMLARYHRVKSLKLLDAVRGRPLVILVDGKEHDGVLEALDRETWRVWVRGVRPFRPTNLKLCDPNKIRRVPG